MIDIQNKNKNMVQTAVHNYYKFFDETLKSSTFLVLIIVMLVFIVGTIVPNANASTTYLKGNLMEVQQIQAQKNIIEIEGVKYEIQFERVK